MKENIILQRKIILVLQNTELSKPRLNFSDHYNLVSHNAALESATQCHDDDDHAFEAIFHT